MRKFWIGLALLAAAGALSAAPGDDQVSSAREFLKAGDGIAAEVALKRALDAGVSRSQIAAAMGEALLQQGERRKAREWLGGGDFAPATAVYGWRMLGLLERQEGNLPAAGAAYNQALAITRKDSQLWVDIGRLRYSGGEQREAVGAADEALKFGPDNAKALEFRGQLVRDSYGPAAALPWFEAALAQAPDDPELLLEYAGTLGEAGRAREMLTVTRRLTELRPGHPRALYLQAVLAARAGKYALAKGILDRIKGPIRETPAILQLSGALELEAGNSKLALEALNKLVRKQPANPRGHALLARALYEAGEHKELIRQFGALTAQPGASSYLMTLVAWSHEVLGERGLAAPLLDRAAREHAEVTGIAELPYDGQDQAASRLRALLASGQAGTAVGIAEGMRSARPGFAAAHSFAGDAQLAFGRPREALERYRYAAEIRFNDDLLLRSLLAMSRAGQGGAMGDLLAGYLTGNPQSRVAARLAAGLAARRGAWDNSRAILEILRLRGGERDARLLCDLSLAQLRGGDTEAAVATAEQAYRLQPASAITAQALGMALAEAGERPRAARSLLVKARKLGGGNPLLEEALAKLDKG